MKALDCVLLITVFAWAATEGQSGVSAYSSNCGIYSYVIRYIDIMICPREPILYPADRFDPASTDLFSTPYSDIEIADGRGSAQISFNLQDGNYTFDIIYFNSSWAFLDGELSMLIDGSLLTFQCDPDRDVTDGGSCREWCWFDPSLATIRRIAGGELVEVQLLGEDHNYAGRLAEQALVDLRYFLSLYDPESGYTDDDFPRPIAVDITWVGDSIFADTLFISYLDSCIDSERAELLASHPGDSPHNAFQNRTFERFFTLEAFQNGLFEFNSVPQPVPGRGYPPMEYLASLFSSCAWISDLQPGVVSLSITAPVDPDFSPGHHGSPPPAGK